MKIVLAQPRGYCAGVARAIETVDTALDNFGAPVYVYHDIVHNESVVADLAQRGAVFIDDITTAPYGAVVVFSAHGVTRAVRHQAALRSQHIIDATCPLVSKVHTLASRLVEQGATALVVLGHADHDEVVGLVGAVDVPVAVVSCTTDIASLSFSADTALAYVTQTTLVPQDTETLLTALMQKYPRARGAGTESICYATLNRQRAVRRLAERSDLVLVVGSPRSSNCRRLQEVAADYGVPSRLVEQPSDLDLAWFEQVEVVGVTSGASTPESLVRAVCRRLGDFGATQWRILPGLVETTQFSLPDGLIRENPSARRIFS
jgi:4-hydroxy-3-methylbut-2-enyl diphosphate reductase